MALNDFQGDVFVCGEGEYEQRRYQYATSSEGMTGEMSPAVILYPRNEADVLLAIQHARERGVALAVRTGGHQYSGASSTAGDNLQVDLSELYREFDWDDASGLLHVGVSHSLTEFNAKLGALSLSVPHGQCSHVHLGGHVQTGGYGSFTRAFGLFADHVVKIRLITADGNVREIERDSTDPDDRELFFAVLGGSPGNFGLLTHLTLKPLRDRDYPRSRGMKRLVLYSPRRLRQLLDIMVEMANDDEMPADFDYCISVMSGTSQLLAKLFPGLDEVLRDRRPDLFGMDEIPFWPPVIMVYAQWSNLEGVGQPYDPTWMERIAKAAGPTLPDLLRTEADNSFADQEMPLSELSRAWVFPNVREFLLPFDKRAYPTDSATLVEDRWTRWVTGRVHELMAPFDGCKLTAQFFYWGGKHSRLRTQDDGSTAYSWRRQSNICQILDCFYGAPTLFSNPRETAREWQAENDEEGIGPNGRFCTADRRFLWGSFGDKSLDRAWRHYHEVEAKVDRLLATKRKVDPQGVFSPNAFCLGYEEEGAPETRAAGATRGAPAPPPPPPSADFEERMLEAMLERHQESRDD